tara:strand:+ start:3568 stop:4239 length:672 start_codon:yes stop_codon:yes gene_type:complete
MDNKNTIQENTTQENYFISPVWLNYKPEWVAHLNKTSDIHIKKARKLNKEIIKKTKDFGLTHHSGELQSDPEFKTLLDYAVKESWRFLKHQGFDLTNYAPVVNDMWVQEASKNGGGHHDTHIHQNNHVSGFYFLKSSMKTSQPVFHDPRPAAMMSKLPLKTNIEKDELPLGIRQITLHPNPGAVIIFNSYMPHQYTVDPGIEPFRFIHWNIEAVRKEIINVQN